MGIFKTLFGKEKNEERKESGQVPWIPLTSVEQLGEIKEKSATKTQVILSILPVVE